MLTPATKIGLSVSLATGLYGISFGALAVSAGLSLWETVALSFLMFTGGSQFAFVGVVAGGGSGIAALAASTLVGIRNAVYGMQGKIFIRPPRTLLPLAAHVTIDESIAVALAQSDDDERRRGFWVAGVGVFVLWNLFTIIGALFGQRIDPQQWGLDGAAVAAFVGLLWPRLTAREPVAIAVVAALVTITCIPFLPSGVPILAAALVTVLWGLR